MRSAIKCCVCGPSDEAFEAGDGAEALEAYRTHRPDWVLMDFRMREVNGLEATREIKAAFPEARVLIVTNYDDAELRASALEAGACGYVLKDNLLDLRTLIEQKPPATH
jgi:DNA-binding NarL/FixJ family response regulator